MRADDIRKEILFQLYHGRPLARSVSRITRDAVKGGYDYTQAEVRAECHFLTGDKLTEKQEMPGVTEEHFKITSAGIRLYETTYLT